MNIQQYDDAGGLLGGTSLPDNVYSDGADQEILRSLDSSNGLVAKFGFVPNSGNVSFVSPLDNTVQAYKFDGLRPGGAPGRRRLAGTAIRLRHRVVPLPGRVRQLGQ